MNQQNLNGHSFRDKPQNRNKAGRPKKLPPLIEVVDKVLLETSGGQTGIERMIRGLIDQAINGNIQAARCILEFRYGKPKQAFDVNIGGSSEQVGNTIYTDGFAYDEFGNLKEIQPSVVEN